MKTLVMDLAILGAAVYTREYWLLALWIITNYETRK